MWQAGLLNSGATIAARLSEFAFDAMLTDEPVGEGLARRWELRFAPNARWLPLFVEKLEEHWPYGYEIENW